MTFNDLIKKLFNVSEDKIKKETKENTENNEPDPIIRCVIKYNADGSFRPTMYMEVTQQKDLFTDKEEIERVRKAAEKCCKEVDDEHKLTNYVIFEMPYYLPHDLFKMETFFALLNSHLNITPDKCYIIDIYDLILDENVDPNIKLQLLNMNYAVKIFRNIDLDGNRNTADYTIEKNDMRIALTGAIEKYYIKYQDKYDLVIYRVSIS